MKLHRLLALLLSLAMVLPMTVTMLPASAEESAVAELPTETQTVPVETAGLTKTKAWDFSDASQLSDFSLYQSATSAFAVADGVLVPNGTDGEVKAILTDTPEKLQSVSVDILPGESGNIYGGLYFGASNAANEQDAINSQVFLIKSDYDPAGWSDAINRIDVVQGQFNNGWKHINTVVSETGNKNALFSGSKQALNLKLVFGGEVVLLTLSLVSNSAKYIQLMYEIDAELLDGQLGLRALGSDTKFDNLKIAYSEPLSEGTTAYDFENSAQLSDFQLYQPAVHSGRMNANKTGSSLTFWEAVLNEKYTDIQSVSVNMYNAETDRFFGGFFVGSTDKNLDIAFGCRRGDKSRNEIRVHTGTGHMTARTDAAGAEYSDGKFFTAKFNPVNLTLQFESDKIVATVTNLDDTSKTFSYNYSFDFTKFTGEIGLVSDNSALSFDDLQITYGDGQTVSWNFDDRSQEEDFTVYAPLNSNVHVADGNAVFPNTKSDNLGGELVLQKQFENVKSLYVEISQIQNKMIGGFYLGGLDMVIMAGGAQNNSLGFFVTSSYTNHTINKPVYDKRGAFFSGGNTRETISLTLEFETDKIIATMARLDGQVTPLVKEIAVDMSQFNGEIALVNQNGSLKMDNLKITENVSVPDGPVSYDFEAAEQLSDFTIYDPSEFGISLADGNAVFPNTKSDNLGGELVLQKQFENVKSLYVEISQIQNKMIGGFYLGGLDMVIMAGGAQNNSLGFFVTSSYTNHTINKPVYDKRGAFFSGGNTRETISLTLEFETDKIIATMARLDGQVTPLVKEIAVDMSQFNGVIGLVNQNGSLKMDNLVITCDTETEVTPNTETIYHNKGYNFLETDRWSWELTKPLYTGIYTMEAWVKVPKGIADSKMGYIISNNTYHQVPPYAVLKMNTYGRPSLMCAYEGETGTEYIADVDLRTGQWTHLAYTYDIEKDVVKCYINGEVVETWTGKDLRPMEYNQTITPFNPHVIGAFRNNEAIPIAQKFPGWIADVRLWNRALSDTEINDSMMTQYTQPRDGLLFNAPLDELVNDQFLDYSGNDIAVAETKYKQYNWVEDTSTPGAYSMIVVPDPQIMAQYYPDKLDAMYQWIADNREKENIQAVMTVGDMANHCGSENEWVQAREAVDHLPADLPFIAAPGNHDYDNNSTQGVRDALTLMNQYFPMSYFERYPTEFGAMSRDLGLEDNVANTWQAFEVNGNKYLILALEFKPANDALAWASEVVESHPDHQVIVITHSLVERWGTLPGVRTNNNDPDYKNTPIELWDKFVSQHENIIMTFSGHAYNKYIVRRVDVGVNGNNVHQFLVDAQMVDAWIGAVGMLCMLRFNEDGTLCNISYYSPLKDMCLEEESIFTIELPKQEKSDVAQVGEQTYTTVTEAVANGNMVKLLASTDEAITVSSDVTIDLAGNNLSNVTVSEGAKLNLIDSTATYSGTKGSAAVTGSVEKFVELEDKKYMVIGENGVYTPHRYYVGITHVSLDTATTGFGYKAQFRGDEAVQAQIADIGYDLWLTEDRVVTRTANFKNALTLRLKNFDVENYGETPVNAKAFMTLVDGTKLESNIHSYSMRSMVEGINEAYESFGTEKLTAAAKMILKYETMESWNVANILTALQPKAAVESVTVENQEMTIYGGSAATLTLTGANKFTVQDTVESLQDNPYANWIADYYVTMDAEAQEGLFLAGNYGSYGWIAIPVAAGQTYTQVPVVATLLDTTITYADMVNLVGTFTCGVADTQSANTGATVTVELRLTNPEDPAETIAIKTITLSL